MFNNSLLPSNTLWNGCNALGKKLRFLLKQDERKPDPPPVKTDDRLAVMVGLVLWLIALIVLLIVQLPSYFDSRLGVWTCVAGIALGLFGLVYTNRRHEQ